MRRILLLLLLAPFSGFLSAQITLANFSEAVDPANVLRYDMIFATSQDCYSYVEYGWANGQDSLKFSTDVSDWGSNHAHKVIGIPAQANCFWKAVAFDSTGCYTGPEMSFTTAALPANEGFAQIVSVNGVAGNPKGFILTNTLEANPNRYTQIYDRLGNLIWYQNMPGDPAAAADGPCQHYSYDGASNTIYYLECGTITEMDLEGNNLSTVDLTTIAPGWVAHHDVIKTSSGNWMVLASRVDTVDKSSVGGSANALVVGPGILEISPAGVLVWSWTTFSYYNPLSSPAPGGDWVDKFGPEAINWFDANSVWEDGDGNPMLSFGGTSDVIKVNKLTGGVAWDCGLNGFIEIMVPDTFKGQNSLRPSRPGYYMSLDNRGLGTETRAIEWWIDFGYSNPTMMISWEYTLPTAEFSPEDGSVERLPEGGALIGSSLGKTITEVNSAGTLLWRAVADTTLYKAFWVEDLYDRVNPTFLGDTIVCLNDSNPTLMANPPGGFWSGDFVNNGVFDAHSAGPGDYNVNYKFGGENLSLTLHVDNSPGCGVAVRPRLRQDLAFSAFPNPFQDDMMVVFDLKMQENVIVELFASDGRLLMRQDKGNLSPGRHAFSLDLADLKLSAGPMALCVRTASGKSGARTVLRR